MKKSKLVASLLTAGMIFGVSACGPKDPLADENQDVVAIYNMYKANTEAEGKTPASYEEWLASIKGEKGDKGDTGPQGPQGQNGQDAVAPVVTIGANGNWFVDGVDTNKPSKGEKGQDAVAPVITIGPNGNWFVDGNDIGKPSRGDDGQDAVAPVITIGDNGNWFVDGVDIEKPSKGDNGASAYDIFKGMFPNYAGDEAQWMRDLCAGKLDTFDICDQIGAKIENYPATGKTKIICEACGTTEVDAQIIGNAAGNVYSFFEYKGKYVGVLSDGYFGKCKCECDVEVYRGDEDNMFAVDNVLQVTDHFESGDVISLYLVRMAPNEENAFMEGFLKVTDDDLFAMCNHIGAKVTYNNGKAKIECPKCGEHEDIDAKQIGISWADYFEIISIQGQYYGLHHNSSSSNVDKTVKINFVKGDDTNKLAIGNTVKVIDGQEEKIYKIAKEAVYGGLTLAGVERGTYTAANNDVLVLDGFGEGTYKGNDITYKASYTGATAYFDLKDASNTVIATVYVNGSAFEAISGDKFAASGLVGDVKEATYNSNTGSSNAFNFNGSGIGSVKVGSTTYYGSLVDNGDGTYGFNGVNGSKSVNFTFENVTGAFFKVTGTFSGSTVSSKLYVNSTTAPAANLYTIRINNNYATYLKVVDDGVNAAYGLAYDATTYAVDFNSLKVVTITKYNDVAFTQSAGTIFSYQGEEIDSGKLMKTGSTTAVSPNADAGTYTCAGKDSITLDGFVVSGNENGNATVGDKNGTYTTYVYQEGTVKSYAVTVDGTTTVYNFDTQAKTYAEIAGSVDARVVGNFKYYKNADASNGNYVSTIKANGTGTFANSSTSKNLMVETDGNDVTFKVNKGISSIDSYVGKIVDDGVIVSGQEAFISEDYEVTSFNLNSSSDYMLKIDMGNDTVKYLVRFSGTSEFAFANVVVEDDSVTEDVSGTKGCVFTVTVDETSKTYIMTSSTSSKQADGAIRGNYIKSGDEEATLFLDGNETAKIGEKTYTYVINAKTGLYTLTENVAVGTPEELVFEVDNANKTYGAPAEVEIPYLQANTTYYAGSYKNNSGTVIVDKYGYGSCNGKDGKFAYDSVSGVTTFTPKSGSDVCTIYKDSNGALLLKYGATDASLAPLNTAKVDGSNAGKDMVYVTTGWAGNYIFGVKAGEEMVYYYAETSDSAYIAVTIEFSGDIKDITAKGAIFTVKDASNNILGTFTHSGSNGSGNGRISVYNG